MQVFGGTIGSRSKHEESNDNREILVILALMNGVVVGETLLLHKKILKGTCVSLDGRTINQIDHYINQEEIQDLITVCQKLQGS